MRETVPVTKRRTALVVALVALSGLVGFGVGVAGSVLLGVVTGLVCLAVGVVATWSVQRMSAPTDPSRRRLLAAAGLLGAAAATGGAVLGRTVRRLTRPDPRPVQEAMAHDLGAEYMELVARAFHPDRSGDLQLLVAPFNSANYPQESRSLVPQDPRTSHASVWMYLERVPLVVAGPGIGPSDSVERVSLADVAPTIARMIGFEDFVDLGREGRPLPGIGPGIGRPSSPELVVTFVIDGGGWNVLERYPEAWPNLRHLMQEGANFRNAIHGSFPAVTASAHATIGTGAFPRTHGITGHNIRDGSKVRKSYGELGHADPSDILVPTLADLWSEETANAAWIGELGYQIWHLGMIGHGGPSRRGDERPVAVYWDETGEPQDWRAQNEELFRLPATMPAYSSFEQYGATFVPNPDRNPEFDPVKPKNMHCCSTPVIRYQGDLIEATVSSEPLASAEAPGLLFINYKSPDYTGHVYGMLDPMTGDALRDVDEQLGRLVDQLDTTFPGRYALIVTADHGQCPLPDAAGGVRLDPIQLWDDVEREFGGGLFGFVQSVVPSEIYLHADVLWDAGATPEDVAAFLRDYSYRRNIGPYVPRDAIERDLLDRQQFAAVFATTYLDTLGGRDLSAFGTGIYPEGDISVPVVE